MNRLFTAACLAALTVLFVGNSPVFSANPEVTASNITDYDQANPGKTVPVIYFTITRDNEDAQISSMQISNNGQSVGFGTGTDKVQAVYIYKDQGTIGTFEPSVDLALGSPNAVVLPASDVTTLTLDITPRQDLTASATSVSFFIVYKYGSGISTSDTAGVSVTSVNWGGGTAIDLNGGVVTNTVDMVTPVIEPGPHIIKANVQDYDTANPGLEQPAMFFTLKRGGDFNYLEQIVITNNGTVGFDPNSSSKIQSVRIYKDDGNGTWDPLGSDTNLTDQVTYSAAGDVATINLSTRQDLIEESASVNLFVVYKYGADIPSNATASVYLRDLKWQTNPAQTSYDVVTVNAYGGDITATASNLIVVSTPNSKIVKTSTSVINNNLLTQGNIAPIYYMKLQNISSDTVDLQYFSIVNPISAGRIQYGNGEKNIKRISIYRDDSPTGEFSTTVDTKIGEKVFNLTSEDATQNVTVSQTMSASNETGFYFLYEMGQQATLNAAASFDIDEIKWGSGSLDVYGPEISAMDVSASGIEVIGVTENVVFSFALSGETKVPVLRFTVTPNAENFEFTGVTVNNEVGNFDLPSVDASSNVTISNAGVVAAYLYLDSDSDGSFATGTDTLLKTINNSTSDGHPTFNSKTVLHFSSFTSSQEITAGTTKNYFVVYDIGASTNIREALGESVKAQIPVKGVYGLGKTSQQSIYNFAELPTQDAITTIAGLSYVPSTNVLKSIVSTTNVYGPGMSAPVFQFELTAEGTDVTLNHFIIENNGSIGFRTNSSDTNKVITVNVFTDTTNNANESFDGEPQDQLVASLNLTGSTNTSTLATLPIISNFVVTSNTSQLFYVQYEFGLNAPQTKDAEGNVTSYANGNLKNVLASGNRLATTKDIPLSGDLPTVVTPDARVDIQSATVTLVDAEEIAPTYAVQGQVKMPVLTFKVRATSDISTMSVVVANNRNTFSETYTGINKVWIFKDLGTIGTFDSSDQVLGSTSTFTDQGSKATVSGISVAKTSNDPLDLMVLYDVGQGFDTTKAYSTQISSMTSGTGNSNVFFAGDVPYPTQTTPNMVTASLMSVESIFEVSTTNISNTSPSFNVKLKVRVTTDNVTVNEVSPRFYLKDIAGKDITYEYSIVNDTPSTYPTSQNVSALPVRTYEFVVNPSKALTEGALIMDAFVDYSVLSAFGPTGSVYLQRYLKDGNSWSATTADTKIVRVSNLTNTKYSFTEPDYVEDVKVLNEVGSYVAFENNHAIPSNTKIQIHLIDAGKYLDESSFSLDLNGESYVRENQDFGDNEDSKTYSYDRTNGIITINDTGDTDGTITFSTQDNAGNILPSVSYTFYSSNTIDVENFLFYPNPFSPDSALGADGLIIGFSITKKASVTMYMYDSTGREVYRWGETQYDMGYNEVTWDAVLATTSKYLASGIYIIKIVATASDGTTSMKVTKLAVY